MNNFWKFGALVLLILLLSPYFVFALRIEFDDPKDIKDWELGPGATAEVSNGQLELKVVGGQNSGVFFWRPEMDRLQNGSQSS